MIADAVAIIGTMDIVFGEIDRPMTTTPTPTCERRRRVARFDREGRQVPGRAEASRP